MNTPSKPLKWYRALAGNQGWTGSGAFLVEGEKALNQVMARHPEAIIEVLATSEPPPEFTAYPSHRLTESQFKYISSVRTPQGVAGVVKIPEGVYSDTLPQAIGHRVLLLEDIQDPGNTGTLIRTTAALGFSGVILTDKSADPFSPKCVQATAGSVLSVWLRRTAGYIDLINRLKEKEFTLVAADLNGDTTPEILNEPKDMVLALGNEAAGISSRLLDIADYRVRIPVEQEKAESLNVAACGAILMYLGTHVIDR